MMDYCGGAVVLPSPIRRFERDYFNSEGAEGHAKVSK